MDIYYLCELNVFSNKIPMVSYSFLSYSTGRIFFLAPSQTFQATFISFSSMREMEDSTVERPFSSADYIPNILEFTPFHHLYAMLLNLLA